MNATGRAWGTRCCGEDLRRRLKPAQAARLARLLRLLSHPVRLSILDILARNAGRVCVCDLEAGVPVKQPTVSHHLRLLRLGGLVGNERRGQWMFYFVRPNAWRDLRAYFGATCP